MMYSSFSGRRRGFQLTICATLLLQTLTPLALTLAPIVVARADLRNQYTAGDVNFTFQEPRSYVLKPDDAGDKLDITLQPVATTGKQKKRFAEQSDDIAIQDSESTQIAGYASQAGSFMSSRPDGHAVAGMVKGMAVGKANQTVQEWMSQFGTAQVQLGVDDDFSLKNSALNLLHPWYDSPENMVFSQTGIHRTDDRTQANLGIGYRNFRNNDIFGVNVFLDYDLSRDHVRAGFGGEYWRNFMKLSANAYVHLSGWKESPDIEDYDERPANGWDIRAEGYLPSYPQLGAKVVYEQYYGNEVALFGINNSQKNPHAVTVGVSYTPIPLLTLSADQKTGKNGQHDKEFKAELNYRMGEPLSHQLDTDAVAASRSLMGCRYDLIDRNNNIVLEYRKQDVIRLHVPGRVTGVGGQVIPLMLNVKAKHGLKDVGWDDAALLAAGGKLTGAGTQWLLTLPAWKPGDINAWSVMAVAHDTKGNASKPTEMQIVLTPQTVHSAIMTAQPERLQADGVSTSTVTLTLKDNQGNAITGQENQLSLSGVLTPDSELVHGGTKVAVTATTRAINPKLTDFKETTPGVYVATLTTGTEAGEYVLSAELGGRTLAQITVVLEDTAADISQSTLTSDRTTMTANGTDEAVLTLSLKKKAHDGSLQGVTGEAPRLTFFVADTSIDSTKYTFTAPQEGNAGNYTTHFSGLQAATQLSLGVKIHGKDSGLRVLMDLTTGTTVIVSGNPIVGETLTATLTCTTACGATTYQWQIESVPGSDNWSNITGATGMTYRPAKEDQKKRIRVEITE